MTVHKLALVIGMAVATTLPAWGADNRGSAEDQLACTPDVYRLCSQFIPNEDDIVACLSKRKAQLSVGCKAVFSRPTQPKASQDEDE